MGKLRKIEAELAARDADPWHLPLERLRGKVGDDGIERITTQTVFDILEISQRNRSASACRRLAKLMTQLGWTAVRVRGLTRGGYREQVRGYARDKEATCSLPRGVDYRCDWLQVQDKLDALAIERIAAHFCRRS